MSGMKSHLMVNEELAQCPSAVICRSAGSRGQLLVSLGEVDELRTEIQRDLQVVIRVADEQHLPRRRWPPRSWSRSARCPMGPRT